MHEVLTKTKFINALVREHVAKHEHRKDRDLDTDRQYLRLEIIMAPPRAKEQECRLVIRGNSLGTHWMLWDQTFPQTPDGVRKLHKAALDIAYSAAEKAAAKIGEPAEVGIPPAVFFHSWFNAR